MAAIKIAQLINKTTLADTDIIIVESATATEKMTVANLKNLLGINSGGIVDSGSNANGKFIKYADGTMVCYLFKDLIVPTNTSNIAGIVSLPASYIDTDYIWVATQGSQHGYYSASTAVWGQGMGKSVTEFSVQVNMNGVIGAEITLRANIIVIGRWKA